MSALYFEDVAISIERRPLFAPLNFRIAPGTTTCVVGPSGSGKSSLLGLACGFLPPQMHATGQVRLGNKELTQLVPQDRGLGLMFQEPLLFAHLSVASNILFGLRSNASRAERRAQVDAALSSVGLEQFGDRDPATLSGGQKTRVALLRVLLSKPRALLLDEPFSALDADNRAKIRQLVLDKAREQNLPVLLVTHDEEDVAAASGEVIRLRQAGAA